MKDKLTAYNGTTITYDEIGNPLQYYNGYEFTWDNGRQLASATDAENTITYKYDANGIRTQKTVNGVTTSYILDGSNVVKETNGTDTLWFYYDAAGSVVSFQLNGTAYFYVKNLQGDIIAITNASGTKVVEYTYDSWGKLISTTGSLASTVGVKNPYRYRGYRYDTETGLYYLNSRYYDPEVKRFINADGYLSTGTGVLGNNMFAYCGNNPINRADATGTSWTELWEAFKQTMQQASVYFATAIGISQVDTPAPGPADIVTGIMLLGGVLYCAAVATYTIATATESSIPIPKVDEKDVIIPPQPKKQAYFPANPYDFNPQGLVMKQYPASDNGIIIKWHDPTSNIAIFEWDEDLKSGSHYHAMLIEWNGRHMGTHYFAGDPIPEPWNSLYFGE